MREPDFDRDGFYQDIGMRLMFTRKKRRLTQAQVAEQVGIPRATYANVERGRTRASLDVLWRVAVVLGVRLARCIPEPLTAPRGPDA